MQFILKLQGRAWVGANSRIQVRLYIPNTSYDLANAITFETDASGQQNVTLSNLVPATYDVFLKPTGYLQKKINYAVKAGDNTVDLSGITFLAGDLDADGRIWGLDYNNWLTNYGSAAAVVADLDSSGQVNGLDFSLMLSNWGKCGDGEESACTP